MQKLNVCIFSLMAAGAMALTVASPAVAEDLANVRVISVPKPVGPGAVPNVAYNGLAATNVSVGVETGGLPCGNCVRGGGSPNVGLPWPEFAFPSGTPLTISVLFESTGYTGPCTAQLILKQGTSVIYSTSYPFQGGCQAGYLYGVFFNVPAPATTGFTTVIGSIHGGTNLSGADTFMNVE